VGKLQQITLQRRNWGHLEVFYQSEHESIKESEFVPDYISRITLEQCDQLLIVGTNDLDQLAINVVDLQSMI